MSYWFSSVLLVIFMFKPNFLSLIFFCLYQVVAIRIRNYFRSVSCFRFIKCCRFYELVRLSFILLVLFFHVACWHVRLFVRLSIPNVLLASTWLGNSVSSERCRVLNYNRSFLINQIFLMEGPTRI